MRRRPLVNLAADDCPALYPIVAAYDRGAEARVQGVLWEGLGNDASYPATLSGRHRNSHSVE